MDTRKYLAELVGTFLFLTLGYFSVAAFGAASVPGLLVVPFAFGFGLLAAIFAVGHISAAILTRRSPSPPCSTSGPTRPMRSATSSPR